MKLILAKYREVRRCIGDADLLLYRRSNWIGGLIAAGGRSIYSHAAIAAWWGDSLFCLEMRQFAGGRAVLLSNVVERFPGRVDVYRTNPAGLLVRTPSGGARGYAMFPRLRGTVDGKPCVVDVMEEAEAEMGKTAVVQGRVQTAANIDWSKLLDWLVQNLPKILELIMALVAAFSSHTQEEPRS